MTIDPVLLATIQRRYGFGPIRQVARLSGGEWKQLWQVESTQGAYVVSVSHPTATVASLAYEHRLLQLLHRHLPQVPVPLLAQDGSSYFVEGGALICLLPFMPGQSPDRTVARLPAARLLARFHRLGRDLLDLTPRPGFAPWSQWGWGAERWPLIEGALASTPATADRAGQRFWQATGHWADPILAYRQPLVTAYAELPQWLAALTQSGRQVTRGLIHDDYHRKNLLMQGDVVTAFLDWDGAHPDWLLWDLSNAVWEFCLDQEEHTLLVPAAQAFLQAYGAAGGVVPTSEFDLIIPLIRCRRLVEIINALSGIVTGEAWDESPDYLVHGLIALEKLQGVELL